MLYNNQQDPYNGRRNNFLSLMDALYYVISVATVPLPCLIKNALFIAWVVNKLGGSYNLGISNIKHLFSGNSLSAPKIARYSIIYGAFIEKNGKEKNNFRVFLAYTFSKASKLETDFFLLFEPRKSENFHIFIYRTRCVMVFQEIFGNLISFQIRLKHLL